MHDPGLSFPPHSDGLLVDIPACVQYSTAVFLGNGHISLRPQDVVNLLSKYSEIKLLYSVLGKVFDFTRIITEILWHDVIREK